MEIKTIASNRKALHLYEILESVEAGIVLAGYEVKSARARTVTLGDGMVRFDGDAAWLESVHIAPYAQQSTHIQDYEPTRRRRLLLHKSEIHRLSTRVREKGLTVVPLEMYFSARGIAKVRIGLGKGKRAVDKRETLRRRDMDRDMEREMK